MKKLWVIISFICFMMVGSIPLKIQAQVDYQSTYRWDYRSWMEDSYAQLKDKTLSEICLPATHDSGTYNLDIFSPGQISERLPSFVAKIMGKDFVAATSITQEADIYTQLNEGIRRFDIRFKIYDGDGEFRIFHGMFGSTFDEIVTQFKDFMNENPNEVIFFRLNGAGEMWDFPDDKKRELGQMFMDAFGDVMIGSDDGISFANTTFEEVIQSGKRMIVHCPDDVIRGEMSNTFQGPDLYESYVGGDDVDATVQGTLEAYDKWDSLSNDPNSRFEAGLVFSFRVESIISGILNNLLDIRELLDEVLEKGNLEVLNKRARGKFYNVFKHIGESGTKPVSIYTSDFYPREFVELAILRNFGVTRIARKETYLQAEEAYSDNPTAANSKNLALIKKVRTNTMDMEVDYVDEEAVIKLFPYGGEGGYHDFSSIRDARIVKIGIRGADRVDALTFVYADGMIMTYGGTGGSYKEISLAFNEYITDLVLCTSNRDTIGYMEVRTNKGQVLANGKRTTNRYDLNIPIGWQLAGLEGTYADEIDKLTPICQPVRENEPRILMSNSLGGEGGSPFNFVNAIPAESYPKQLSMRAADRLDQISIQYDDNTTLTAGGSGGNYSSITLDDGEYLMSVKLSVSKRNTVGYAEFCTNKGRVFSGGKIYGETITITAPDNYCIAGFYGRDADEIDKLGVIFKELP